MELMNKIDRLIFDKFLGVLAKGFGIVMTLSVIVQIACRYLPITPLRWTEELARLTFAWFCFISAAMTFAQNKHLSMDFLYSKLGPKTRHVLDIVGQLAILVFSIIVTFYGIKLLSIVSMQRSPMLRISMKYFYASMPFGGILFCIKSLMNLIHYLRGGQHLEPTD